MDSSLCFPRKDLRDHPRRPSCLIQRSLCCCRCHWRQLQCFQRPNRANLKLRRGPRAWRQKCLDGCRRPGSAERPRRDGGSAQSYGPALQSPPTTLQQKPTEAEERVEERCCRSRRDQSRERRAVRRPEVGAQGQSRNSGQCSASRADEWTRSRSLAEAQRRQVAAPGRRTSSNYAGRVAERLPSSAASANPAAA